MWFEGVDEQTVPIIGFGIAVLVVTCLFPFLVNLFDMFCEKKFGVAYDLFYSLVIAIITGYLFSFSMKYVLGNLNDEYQTGFLWVVGIGIALSTIVFHRTKGRGE